MANKPDEQNEKQKPPSSDAIEGLEGAASAHEASLDPKKPHEPISSDESINLGEPGEGVELSGISVIEWASLAESASSDVQSSGSTPRVSTDSPSDAELLKHHAESQKEPPAPTRRVTMVAKEGELPSAVPGRATILAKPDEMPAPVPSRATILAKPGDMPAALPARTTDVAKPGDLPAAIPGRATILAKPGELPAAIPGRTTDVAKPGDLPAAVPGRATILAKPGELPAATPGRKTILAKPGEMPAPTASRPTMLAKSEEIASALEPGAASDAPERPRSRKSTVHAPPPEEDSGIELTEDAIIVEEAGVSGLAGKEDSAIDLTADAIIVEELSSPPRKSAGSDSGIDLGTDSGIEVVAESASNASGKHKGSESGIDLIAEDVILEERPATAANGGSSRDLIAEGLESGDDLSAAKKTNKDAKKTVVVSEDALEEFLISPASEDPSSSVDLGSVHNVDVFKEEDMFSGNSRPSGQGDSNIRPSDLVESTAADVEVTESGVAPVKKPARETEMAGDIDFDASGTGEDAGIEVDEAEPEKVTHAAETADEDQEVVAVDEPKKKGPKPPSRTGAWLGGTAIGALVGAGACVALWVFGLVGGSTPAPKSGVISQVPIAPPMTFAATLDQIKNGDLDKVKPEDLARVDASKPDQLVARAEYHWLSYLKSERGKNLKADAEPVKKALEDLNKAVDLKNADALFLRAQIHELTGKPDEARNDYQKGAKEFAADPLQRQRFETALLVMDMTPRVAHLVPPGMPPSLLAMMLIAFQAPPGPAGVPDEAGFSFWDAIKQARDGKWAKAVEALDKAKANHEQRRFLFPQKQQNPLSDPREKIFLYAADEIKAYWTLLARLGNPGYLDADAKERDKAVDKLIDKAKDAAAAAQLKDLTEKLAKGKSVAKSDDLIKALAEQRKVSADKIALLEGTVEGQTKKLTNLDETLKKTTKELTETQDMLKAVATREKELQTASAAADAALKEIGEAAGVKFVDLKTSRETLVKEVREIKKTAGVVDSAGTLTRLQRELAADRAKLKERWEPAQMLGYWLAILQGSRSRSDLGSKAMLDAERVLNSPSATSEQKGQALLVRGLVLRNEEKFDEAKAALEKAQAALVNTKGDWLKQAAEALREVSNPGADLSSKADALASSGKPAEALALLDRGLKTWKGNKGPLYAQRALIVLESARSKGPLSPNDPQVQVARRDAAEAAKDGVPEGFYAAGRLAEEFGQFDEAIKSYRAAIAALKSGDEAGSRYRMALARALIKSRAPEAATSASVHMPLSPAGTKAVRGAPSLRDFSSLMLVLTLQPADAGLSDSEAQKLADEVLAMGDKVPFDVRAQAWAVKGQYTRALTVYANGLRDKGLLAPAYANGLLDMINGHPGLRRSESPTVRDPIEGEKHYAAGVNFFFAHRYAEAEKEFIAAVENDTSDARYYYFLGLSRLALNKREGFEDFDQAARLERLGRPGRAAVSTALERVQGSARRALNEVRNRPEIDTSK